MDKDSKEQKKMEDCDGGLLPAVERHSQEWNRNRYTISGFQSSRPGFDLYPGPVIPDTYKVVLQWLPCQTSSITGSVLGLIGWCQCTAIR